MPTITTLILPANLHSGRVTGRDGMWQRDSDGAIFTTKRLSEVLRVVLDWQDLLASGETVSSAAYVDSGTTRTSVSVSSPQTLCNVTGLGEFQVTITTSASRTPQLVVRFYDAAGGRGPSDYP